MASSSHLPILFFFLLLSFSLSSLSLTVSERCHPEDKKALLQIKKDFNYPYILKYWDPKTDCCNWYAVDCDDRTNRIINLHITTTDLKLPIPAAVGDLHHLQSLVFSKANVTGEIPPALSKLSQLNFLYLRWNLLTGPVPSFLGQLKKLTYIGLSFNSFTGSIPPSISQLPELNGLLLDRNRLTGGIPESFGFFKQQNFFLYLSHNQLSGPIPKTLGYTNFTFLDVSRNRLEGDISFMFGKNKSMNTADFSRNLFEFDFSGFEFSEKLANLDLNHNRIFGRLPAKIELITMNVSYNRLCGRIPVTGRLQEMEYTAFFHNRCLCGSPLPECK